MYKPVMIKVINYIESTADAKNTHTHTNTGTQMHTMQQKTSTISHSFS